MSTTTHHHPADGILGFIDADGWINRRPGADERIDEINAEATTCGACGAVQPNLAAVFSHTCPALTARDGEQHVTEARDDINYQPTRGTGNGRRQAQPASARQEELIASLMKSVLGSTDADVALALDGLTGGRGGTASALIDSLFAAKHAQAATTPAPAPAPAADCRPNRFAGSCHRCGGHVAAEAGFLCRIDNRWAVEHNGPCPTIEATPAPAGRTSTRPRADVPAGRYALDGTESAKNETVFYRVDRPEDGPYAGRVYVKRIVGGHDDRNVPFGQIAGILDRIAAAGVMEATIRYGREIGVCGHCGRTLTDDASREAGIGPVCAAKLGW